MASQALPLNTMIITYTGSSCEVWRAGIVKRQAEGEGEEGVGGRGGKRRGGRMGREEEKG